ncbi:phage head spike fiber domain-containing protein [Bosea sp. NPDC055594]
MSQQIAVGECSTEEDLGIEWVFVSGYAPAGKTLEVAVRERSTATLKTTLTVGSGLTIVGASVKARVSKATMSAWARTEYTADLVDKMGGAPKRLVPTRIIFDEPGKLVGGVSGNSFRVTQAENRFVIIATTGETGPVGPAISLSKGALTILPPGSQPNFSISGSSPSFTVDMSLTEGPAGAGAPTSADILALADRDDLMREIAGAGVPDRPIAILDFVRGVYWVKGVYAGASIPALVAAIPGSLAGRASTATYFDSGGLLKTAAIGVLRTDYDPITRVCRGLLRDPVRTNLVTYSEQLDNAAWGKYRTTIVPNAAVAPDGLATADKVVEDTTASNTHTVAADVTTSESTQYWLSIFVKAGERTRCEVGSLIFAGQDERTAVSIDLITGAYTVSGVNPAAKVENCGNGWWRVSVKSLRNATANYSRLNVSLIDASGNTVYTGDGTSGIYVWGGQIEEGSSSSSYIPTTASTAARAIESLQIGTEPWLNLAEGSILVEFEAIQPGAGNDFAFNMGTGGLADFIAVYRNSAGSGPGYVRSIRQCLADLDDRQHALALDTVSPSGGRVEGR